MKAILTIEGDLEVILEEEQEIPEIISKGIYCPINWEKGSTTGTQIFLTYNSKENKDELTTDSQGSFSTTKINTLTLYDKQIEILADKLHPKRSVGIARRHQKVQIYAPGEFFKVGNDCVGTLEEHNALLDGYK